ncbi:hypothetical protein [Kitasatospora sp. NPDC059571]|uniref:hypothetical protein n=1 Tax=Kitasatospora sp. NPDC059571 TaxID=3346871 RepID=UPI003696BCBB
MSGQDSADAASEAVTTLHYSGDAEQDHLLDEIQHPETTNALYELAARLTAPVGSPPAAAADTPPPGL